MFSICVFYYLFFLYCVPTLEAGPIECLSSDEHLQCVFPCPTSEVECVNGEIRRSCLNSAEPCTMQCVCKPGLYRSYLGDCLPEENCAYNRDMRSPKSHIHHEPFLCPPNEEYALCKKSCPPDTCISLVARFKCDSREECIPGCACKSGFLRKNADGPCMPIRECPELASSPDFL
ncbi:inducible metalloproteinase inhibitor protein-like isoform X3 [Pieris napi]|uniref:inducible metalloproteinase inhibitor protein-like isoform X3 n=1 Tax=Pieris napi TaxID=78633 RepID=UPI001FBA29EC|nr:inducible metalloproteinase inhibitor protein-like isoform X3 [Pieris napi]